MPGTPPSKSGQSGRKRRFSSIESRARRAFATQATSGDRTAPLGSSNPVEESAHDAGAVLIGPASHLCAHTHVACPGLPACRWHYRNLPVSRELNTYLRVQLADVEELLAREVDRRLQSQDQG